MFRCYLWRVSTSVFDATLETFAGTVKRNASADTIDSALVGTHHCAVGLRKGVKSSRRSAGCAVVHHQAPGPVRLEGAYPLLLPDPGQAHDVQGIVPSFRMLTERVEALLAEKGYDADATRDALAQTDVEAMISAKSNRRMPIPHNRANYRWRKIIERLFNKLRDWRRAANPL